MRADDTLAIPMARLVRPLPLQGSAAFESDTVALPSPQVATPDDPVAVVGLLATESLAFVRDVLSQTVERVVISRRQRRGRGFERERVSITWKD
jgi:hypothetical protein